MNRTDLKSSLQDPSLLIDKALVTRPRPNVASNVWAQAGEESVAKEATAEGARALVMAPLTILVHSKLPLASERGEALPTITWLLARPPAAAALMRGLRLIRVHHPTLPMPAGKGRHVLLDLRRRLRQLERLLNGHHTHAIHARCAIR